MTAGHVHQIRFGFDERVGRLAVAADSFGDSEMTNFWHDELNPYYRTGSVDSFRPPQSAFTHLRFSGGHSVLLYRRTEPGDAARNLSHALIGDEFDLDELALPLTTWRGWREGWYANGWLTRLSLDEFHVQAEDLDEPARRAASEASGLLAAMLRNPDAKFSVQGMPDEHVVPSLWAVRRIMSVIADAMQWSRDWTFSTYETSDASRPNLPALLFLPEGASRASDIGRVRIRHERLSHEYGMLADTLLSLYRTRNLDELRREIGAVVHGKHDIHGRIDRLINKWGHSPSSADLLWSAEETAVVPLDAVPEFVPVASPAQSDALVEAMVGLTDKMELLSAQLDLLVRTMERSSQQSSPQRPSPPPPHDTTSHLESAQHSLPRPPGAQLVSSSMQTEFPQGVWAEVRSQLESVRLRVFFLVLVLLALIALVLVIS
jgi:hypothetical protein